MKTFGLMSLQLFAVLAIMVLVDFSQLWTRILPDKLPHFAHQVVFYVIGIANLMSVLALYLVKDRYPANYLLMALTTALSGLFWGMTRSQTDITLHFQIVGILAFTMLTATVVSAMLSKNEFKLKGSSLLLASLGPGWLVGCVTNALVSTLWLPTGSLEVLGALGFSFLLLCIMLLDAGKVLVNCEPDEFMTVIVSMESSLLVVVSIPFFVLSFCLLHTGEAVLDTNETEAPPTTLRPDEIGAPNALVLA